MAGFGWPGPKRYISATTPGVGDDIDDDFHPFSLWIDTVGVAAYICISNARGAAVWKKLTP